jgi:hypothetical protein
MVAAEPPGNSDGYKVLPVDGSTNAYPKSDLDGFDAQGAASEQINVAGLAPGIVIMSRGPTEL